MSEQKALNTNARNILGFPAKEKKGVSLVFLQLYNPTPINKIESL